LKKIQKILKIFEKFKKLEKIEENLEKIGEEKKVRRTKGREILQYFFA